MSYRTYIPKRGDLVYMNFSPSAGHEMADRHYALVLSSHRYNRESRMCIVCPITSRVRGWACEVALPEGLLPSKAGIGKVSSVVIADGVRQVDFRQREMAFVAAAPPAVTEQVAETVVALVEED